MKQNKLKLVVSLFVLVFMVFGLSLFSNRIWSTGGQKQEHQTERSSVNLILRKDATISEFGSENNISTKVLMKAFGLRDSSELERKVGELGMSDEQITERISKTLAMSAEFGSKNWIKIPIKLALWLVMVIIAFRLMRRAAVTSVVRRRMYLAAVVVFGIVLGNEPSPMNTLTDTAALFGQKGIIFPPRAIVLTVFLIIGILANKFICGWGCQFGTLQDLLFRLNRNKEEKPIVKQIKFPFVITNTVRGTIFLLFFVLALGWGIDIIAPINPFKIYAPAAITAFGGVVLGLLLIASLFVYRPWCHLVCPFGFLGWLTERTSRFKIKVNYDTCIACEKCAAACPSTAMETILKRERVVADCFSCGTCVETCPTRSIEFANGPRLLPPAGKFEHR